MSESTFSADLDALIRGETIASDDELTRFVTDLYGEEQNVTMPNALKLRIANDLGLNIDDPARKAAPVSRRTQRASEEERRGSRPWAIAFAIAAAVLLALTGILHWGMPTGNDEPDNHFLAAPTVVPTVAATPGVSPESNEWMIPYTEAECPEDELMDRAEWIQLQNERAASYRPDEQPADEPYSPANNEDSEAVVSRQRDAMACINRGDNPADRTDAALPIESPRRAWEGQVDPETNQAILEDRMERSKALSTWVEEEMGLTPSDLVYPTDDEVGLFWPPSHAIDLGDGRIALLPAWLMPDMEPPTSIEFNVPVWIEHNGEWLLDEELSFCIGDCDDYWTQLESDISKLATPVASPESSPVADQSWLQPIGIDDCPEGLLDPAQSMENPSGRHYSEEEYAAVSTDRAYGPYSVPSGNDTVEVSEAQRLYAACGWSIELTRPLWTARFEYERWTMSMDWASDSDAQELSAWYQDELGLTVDDVVFEVEMSEVGVDPAGPDHITVGYLPEHAVQLSDGRVAVPESQVTYRSEVTTREHRPRFLLSTTTVYVELDGEWLLDEYIPICIGDCDQYWEQRASVYPNQATPLASPESSPVAVQSWPQPIAP